MEKLIVHPDGNGGIVVLVPSPDCGLTVEQIAQKDVPNGVPFNIIDRSQSPQDSLFRDAWEFDFSAPDGHGNPAVYWGAQQ